MESLFTLLPIIVMGFFGLGLFFDLKYGAKMWSKEWSVSEAPDLVSQAIIARLAGLTSVKIEQQTAGTISIRQSRQVKTVVPLMVLLFPIGLLFLLARDRKTAVVTLLPSESGTKVTVSGPVIGAVRFSPIELLGEPKDASLSRLAS